jgi:ubiquinone/menaquinone biosynthesis C-methylase UbiE
MAPVAMPRRLGPKFLMGFYQRHIWPRILDLVMRNPASARLRADLIPHARGEVLEVGLGSGLNLPFYAPHVHRVYGVDPSEELQRMARERAASGSLPVELLCQSAEDPLPLQASSIDTVVVTWTLCSIPNPSRALQQMRRVSKSTGQLIFIEHGLAPDAKVAAWQERLTPMWQAIAGGCHLNRRIEDLIRKAGFEITECKRCYLPGPRPMTYTYQGIARVA